MELTHSEWLELHGLTTEIHLAETEGDLALLLAENAPKILAADAVSWDVHRGDVMLNKFLITPEYVAPVTEVWEELTALLPTHPMIERLQEDVSNPGTLQSHGTHDFITDPEVQDTAIFKDVYRKMEIGGQMSSHVYVAADFGVLLTASCRKRFSERSRLKFDLLLPHIRSGGRRLLFHARLSRVIQKCPGEACLADLTRREREILPMLLRGKSDPEMALVFGISNRTVEKHTASLLEKLNLENRKVLISLLAFA